MSRALPLAGGSPAGRRMRAALDERFKRRSLQVIGPLPRCHAARHFWSERAWSEYAAIPAMSQASLALVREGGPLDEIAAIQVIAADEARHTEASRDLAEAFGGYVDDLEDVVGYHPDMLAEPCEAALSYWILGNGCISETVSLELMRARMAYTRHPVVKRTLAIILKDEATHARTSWVMAERVFPTQSESERSELADHAEELFRALARTFITRDLPRGLRRRARRIRQETADLGFGAAPPDAEDEVYRRTIEQIIRPRLAALGLPFRDAGRSAKPRPNPRRSSSARSPLQAVYPTGP